MSKLACAIAWLSILLTLGCQRQPATSDTDSPYTPTHHEGTSVAQRLAEVQLDPAELQRLLAEIAEARSNGSKKLILRAERFSVGVLAAVCETPDFEHLELYQATPGRLDLRPLRHLQTLNWLRLDGIIVDDAQLLHVLTLPDLRILNLPDADCSDQVWRRVTELSQLELLRFSGPRLTAKSLSELPQATKLRFIHTLGVPVTDETLAAWREMKQLESLYIDGGQQTDAGLSQLMQALPKLHLHRDQLHVPGDPRADGH